MGSADSQEPASSYKDALRRLLEQKEFDRSQPDITEAATRTGRLVYAHYPYKFNKLLEELIRVSSFSCWQQIMAALTARGSAYRI